MTSHHADPAASNARSSHAEAQQLLARLNSTTRARLESPPTYADSTYAKTLAH